MTSVYYDNAGPVDILRQLLGVGSDAALGAALGVSRQAIWAARKRGRLSRNILEAAAVKSGLPEQELRNRVLGKCEQSLREVMFKTFMAHFNRLAVENQQLRLKNGRLLKENFNLSLQLARAGVEIEEKEEGRPGALEYRDLKEVCALLEDVLQKSRSLLDVDAKNPLAALRVNLGNLEEWLRKLDVPTLAIIREAMEAIKKELLRAAVLTADAPARIAEE